MWRHELSRVAPSSALLDLIFSDVQTAFYVPLGSLREHLLPPEPFTRRGISAVTSALKAGNLFKAVIFRGGARISR